MKAEFWNGNMAAARAAQRARVQAIAAYPITPQTHTVEYLAKFVADGELRARLTKVESEHSALSACVGASSVGARTFTASCSQGIALMSEVLFFAAGLRLPIVMAVSNRTLSVPVNIWSDHQDTLVNRDTGWMQFYAGSVQEVYDLTFTAFKIAEDSSVLLPVMVAYDGFILSHASEPIVPISAEQADAFMPPPGQGEWPILDPDKPQQFGEVLFPEWYPDFEYKKHQALVESLGVAARVWREFGTITGRALTPIDTWFCEDAELIFVGIGSMMQTTRAAVVGLRARGASVGLVNIRSFRPFPEKELRQALEGAARVVVLDRDIGYGTTGMVFPDVLRSLYPLPQRPTALNMIIGTGGKEITPQTIERCFELGMEASGERTVLWPDARGPEEGIPYDDTIQLPRPAELGGCPLSDRAALTNDGAT
jgi:pyruvate ferredoxin oxidoreductase alpha subunit